MSLSQPLPRSTDGPAVAPPSPAITKRDGSAASFDPLRIEIAVEKAYRADIGLGEEDELPPGVGAKIRQHAAAVIQWCCEQSALHVEHIQDEVERTLMVAGEHSVARRYVLYREQRAQARRQRETIAVRLPDGTEQELDRAALRARIQNACAGLPAVNAEAIIDETLLGLFHGMPKAEMHRAAVFAARARIELDPQYSYVTARLLLTDLYEEVTGTPQELTRAQEIYTAVFRPYFTTAAAKELLDERLLRYDLDRLAAALDASRDLKFQFLGLQTLYDRYLIQDDDRRIELPQIFWMRVAMGLALNEDDPEARAIEFYDLLSQFYFTSATPTLFNSGTRHPQLSSCYLTTVSDDLSHIFKCVRDNALLSKWAGGLGNDWTRVRALGARIKGTNGKSQGVIPFLKVANDTAVAVNQGGKRKGAVCAYLETWHLDIEEFLELRKNTGDERRRTHDMNTANWIPDLFMKRVAANGSWTLFSPNDVPDLHDLTGAAFEARYLEYEAMAALGQLRLHKKVQALDLWRRMLTTLFETGHPWITWKDPSNVRSPQSHCGVIHSSNLCTEILLNTSEQETAVCNLGSVNLAAHVHHGQLDLPRLEKTVRTAVRMLDNVIDINYYPTEEARAANLRHRPVGLGIMGFQDALYACGTGYADAAAVEFADRSMEAISYYAILTSTELAAERGTYETYEGSKWSQGLLPIDTIDILERERGAAVDMDRSVSLDWAPVREALRRHGMRNSNVLAIAPTATISNIIGVGQSIEPTYKNLYVKSNLSGEFTTINTYLVADLKREGLWDRDMIDDLKYFDGSLQEIERIPEAIKQRYLTAFELDPAVLIECASRRQKWIDMGQSLNLYMAAPSGKKLSTMYFLAWTKGLKTTYYLRTLGATSVEKSTLDINRRGIQPRWMKSKSASSDITVTRNSSGALPAAAPPPPPQVCNLGEECEACQ